MTNAYRLPDNPLARALEQARADLTRQRAEQDERDRANAAAVEDLRAMLGALDPPLALRMEPERGLRYEGQDAPVFVVAWAPVLLRRIERPHDLRGRVHDDAASRAVDLEVEALAREAWGDAVLEVPATTASLPALVRAVADRGWLA